MCPSGPFASISSLASSQLMSRTPANFPMCERSWRTVSASCVKHGLTDCYNASGGTCKLWNAVVPGSIAASTAMTTVTGFAASSVMDRHAGVHQVRRRNTGSVHFHRTAASLITTQNRSPATILKIFPIPVWCSRSMTRTARIAAVV